MRGPAELHDRPPQRRPLLGGPVAGGRLVREDCAPQPTRRRVARLGDRDVGVVQRDVGHPDEPVGRIRAEVGEPPVVGGEADTGEVGVAARERGADGRAEQDLGVDAVDVLVLHARGRLEPAGADVGEAPHAHRILLGATTGCRREGHHRLSLSLEHLEVALVGPLDGRRAVPELGRQVLGPHLRRRIDVRVRRDSPERSFAHRCSFPRHGRSRAVALADGVAIILCHWCFARVVADEVFCPGSSTRTVCLCRHFPGETRGGSCRFRAVGLGRWDFVPWERTQRLRMIGP